LVAVFVLAASPVALGDGTTDQLVVPGSNGVDCVGFLVETLDGTVNGCTPEPDGVAFFFKKGRVIAARPGAGKQLPDGAKVALTASKGRRGSSR
jgi:hypothetical protein